jgi:hypothetical protein
MHRKPLLWIAALAVAAVLGLSAQASAATVKGTVVHANKSAHTFVVASRRGSLTVVSSRKVARAGSVVRVSGRKTKNGLKARRLRVKSHTRHARLRGIVTWKSASGHTVAAHGASLLVHRSSSGNGAPVGTPVEDDVTIDDQGDLNEDDCHHAGDVPGQIELEGVVLATDPAANTITISGDDDQEEAGAQMSDDNGSDDQGDDNDDQGEDLNPQIVVHVPDATQFTVGQKVELIVTGPAADGSFTLVKVDEQENEGQDEGNQGQNPGPGSDDGSGDHHGDGSGSGGGDD